MTDGMALPHCAKGVGKATATLNVRTAPRTNAKIVGALNAGDNFTIWAKDGDWCIIQRADGLIGWSSATYMTLGALIP